MVRQEWSDDDLVQRLHERDPEALETLISRYSREIFYFIRLVLDGIGVAQDAEECVNDLFVAVWQEIDSFDPGRGTLRTWLTMRAHWTGAVNYVAVKHIIYNRRMKTANGHHQTVVGGGKDMVGEAMIVIIVSLFLHIQKPAWNTCWSKVRGAKN